MSQVYQEDSKVLIDDLSKIVGDYATGKISRIKGMLYGVALGDALGIPHEFYTITPKMEYTGAINTQKLTIRFQFVNLEIPGACVSDDSEMSIVLLRHLIQNNLQIKKDKLVLEYMEWAGQSRFLGKNTRALLKGIKTLRGYTNRIQKLTSEDKNGMQSNGSLMRASALVLVSPEDAVLDTNITNENQVNRDATLVYQQILKILLNDGTKNDTIHHAKEVMLDQKISESVKTAISGSFSEQEINIGKPVKGWVLTSLYIALKAFWKFETFEEAMKYIIADHPGSDTDTNGAIAGAIFGCYLGFEKLQVSQKQNIEILDKYFKTAKYGLDENLWLDLHKLI